MKFYRMILKPIPNEQVIPYTYGTAFRPTLTANGIPVTLNPALPTLEERMPDKGKCPSCGRDEWMILAPEHPAVDLTKGGGGKPYIECLHCGHPTHL
jgi:hypothetical protein